MRFFWSEGKKYWKFGTFWGNFPNPEVAATQPEQRKNDSTWPRWKFFDLDPSLPSSTHFYSLLWPNGSKNSDFSIVTCCLNSKYRLDFSFHGNQKGFFWFTDYTFHPMVWQVSRGCEQRLLFARIKRLTVDTIRLSMDRTRQATKKATFLSSKRWLDENFHLLKIATFFNSETISISNYRQ